MLYVSYLPSGSISWGGAQGVGFVLSEPGVLQDRVSSSPVDTNRRSGVAHLEFFVLHWYVDAVSEDAGLSSVVPRAKGRGECIASKFRELSTFRDSLGVIGEWGIGDLKVVRAWP